MAAPPVRPLVLAHYYIWFTPGSWNRAKTDTPLVGRYSSDDVEVMKTQVAQAQAAGIDGFIVSWKSTPPLNDRLVKLVGVAAAANFKLAITYQGLDFNRALLPTARIAGDIDYFAEKYANDPVFDIFGKPMVVLTGTSVMSRSTLRTITMPNRDRLLILASDKNVASYERIASEVDGNLYYWSSVNPESFGGYAAKLKGMSDAVRARGGIWVAPVAPGFDARLVGGQSTVERRDGQTMRQEWAAALDSTPAAIGVISWNEFSENTHIEPSKSYGHKYLDVLADLTGTTPLPSKSVDSSEPAQRGSPLRAILALSALAILFVGVLVVAVLRGPRPRRALSGSS